MSEHKSIQIPCKLRLFHQSKYKINFMLSYGKDHSESNLSTTSTNSSEMNYEKSEIGKDKTESKTYLPSEIVIGLKNGNHHAFETVFHTFYQKVKLFIKALIKNEDMAEELTQQVFVDLWINKEKVDHQKNISAYIYTMAKNTTITAIKQQVRFEPDEFEQVEQKDSSLTDDRLIAKETELLINLIVESMPPKRKQVYEMSRNENKSNEEIANELNISKKVVEKHLRLAIKELKDVLIMLGVLFI